MSRYILQLSYNGTRYHGWQIQENAVTVQECVNKALSVIFDDSIETIGAGRTDTGVHARHYIAHFDSKRLMPYNKEKLLYKLNCILPKDIVIIDIYVAENDFHARFDAISRTYKYFISRKKNPFNLEFSYYLSGTLDVESMNDSAVLLYNYRDFTSFSKLKTDVKTNNCKVFFAKWEDESDDMLVFNITADRFLRNMVRAIVGTLIEVGKGKISVNDFKNIIEIKDRGKAGMSVPAQGLFLWHINYNNL